MSQNDSVMDLTPFCVTSLLTRDKGGEEHF
jgi:hypothetical protein